MKKECMTNTNCFVCNNNRAITHLPIRLSIDCATSTYVSCHSLLPICQTCIAVLGDDVAVNKSALDAAVQIIDTQIHSK